MFDSPPNDVRLELAWMRKSRPEFLIAGTSAGISIPCFKKLLFIMALGLGIPPLSTLGNSLAVDAPILGTCMISSIGDLVVASS